MTGSGTHDARQFLASVDAVCRDLAAADRERLLGGLEEHLAELAAEGVDLVAELGDPVSYAHELRAAAGLPAVAAGVGAGVGAGAPGGGHGPQTRALPLGPPTAALPLGATQPGPTTGKVLLVVAAVLAGIAVLVTAALVFGGLFFFTSSSNGGSVPVPVVSEMPATAEQQAVAVPDVRGMSAEEARTVLESAGLVVRAEQTPPGDTEAGRVVGQEPAAGTLLAPGSTVAVTVTTTAP